MEMFTKKNNGNVLPSEVSAKVAKANIPMRQPMKNEDCGKPVMKLLAHSRFH
jgi:hypothetical protein